ncbi:G-type lectin S-receptor-like serine/threonine-protein kinase [Camellia lanceoleosa]|nr:G-type lectin S-receptor-like serine/threonine-protein kinase [Camellia lanceoleosa]
MAVGSAAECESSCLNNCSCTAYAYDSNGCSIWIGELMNLQDGSGNTLHLRLAAFKFPKPKGKNGNIIGAVVGSVAAVVLLGLVFVVIWKRQRRRNTDQSEERIVKFFPVWAASVVIKGGDVLSLLDHRLEKHVDVDKVWRICKVACWCIQDDENDRPSMGQVVQILEGILDVEPSPIPRLLQALVAD